MDPLEEAKWMTRTREIADTFDAWLDAATQGLPDQEYLRVLDEIEDRVMTARDAKEDEIDEKDNADEIA